MLESSRRFGGREPRLISEWLGCKDIGDPPIFLPIARASHLGDSSGIHRLLLDWCGLRTNNGAKRAQERRGLGKDQEYDATP
jgi:hypothetical protein